MKNQTVIYCRELDEPSLAGEQHKAGRELLKLALSKEYGISVQEDMIGQEENGKPVLRELPIFFNISHCRGMAVCAISDGPVGVDVEGIRHVTKRLVEKTCNLWEKEYVSGQGDEKSFLELWTLKESYLKMTGEGIRMPFDTVNFQLKEWVNDWRTPGEIQCSKHGYFWQTKLKEQYVLSLCTKNAGHRPTIHRISF